MPTHRERALASAFTGQPPSRRFADSLTANKHPSGDERGGAFEDAGGEDNAGAVVVEAAAVRDTCGLSVVLLLFDDLQEVMSKAGVMTTRTSAARRCIFGAP